MNQFVLVRIGIAAAHIKINYVFQDLQADAMWGGQRDVAQAASAESAFKQRLFNECPWFQITKQQSKINNPPNSSVPPLP